MLQQVKIYNAGLTEFVTVNELVLPLHYPLEGFVWHQPTRGDDLPKAETAGRHDRYTDIDALPIEWQGHFLADTTTEYWTIRKALLAVIVPGPEHSFRYTSRIQIKLDGDSETYWANVDLKDYDAPLQANYPT